MKLRGTLAVSVLMTLGQLGCSGDDHPKKQINIDDSTAKGDGDNGDGDDGDGDVGDGDTGDGDTAVGDGDTGDGDTGDGDTGDGDSGDGDNPPDEPCGGACPDGSACNEQTDSCEPVGDTCPCEPGSHCDETSNTCAPGCQGDEDCAATDRCDSASGTCVTRPDCEPSLVPGLTVSKVTVNQAVTVTLADGGKATPRSQREAPVVQNRGALFRISVTPDQSYVPTEVTAELTLVNGGVETKLTSKDMVSSASDESTLDGTVNITVDAALIGPDTSYSVALTQAACTSSPGNARFPASGTASLEAEKTGRLKVVLVPYERAPYKLQVNEQSLQRIKDGLFALYPIEGVDLTVRESIPVQNPSTNLDRVLQHIRGVRAQDNPPDDVFYFGMFAAADTLREFCGDGCVAGIATLGGDGQFGDAAERYGVGLGYLTDEKTTSHGIPTTDVEICVNTMAHELGHAHGRRHTYAPETDVCSTPAGPDPNFPNRTADIDTYGYNLIKQELYQPKVHKDIMGYCEPNWIHPYTYKGLAARTQGINAGNDFIEKSAPQEYASVIVHHDGNFTWGDNLVLRRPPSGKKTYARAFDATGHLVSDRVPVAVSELADFAGVLATLPVPELSWASLEIEGHTIPVR